MARRSVGSGEWVVIVCRWGSARIFDLPVGPFLNEQRARRYAETVVNAAERAGLDGIRALPVTLQDSAQSPSAILAKLIGQAPLGGES